MTKIKEKKLEKPTLPKTIRILHREFEIRERNDRDLATDHRLGEINFLNSKIEFLSQTGSETADTIVHEILHGLWHMFQIDDPDPEFQERAVSVLSTGLVTVMKDNPSLFPALQELVNKKGVFYVS